MRYTHRTISPHPFCFTRWATPLLEELVLTDIHLHWAKRAFPPTLTRLVVDKNTLDKSRLVSAATILGVLQDLPALRSLELHRVLGDPLPLTLPSPIATPCLAYMHITAPFQAACSFVRACSISPVAKVELSSDGNLSGVEVPTFSATLAPLITTLRPRSLILIRGHLHFSLAPNVCDHDSDSPVLDREHPYVSLTTTDHDAALSIFKDAQLHQSMWPSLDLLSITTLSVLGPIDVKKRTSLLGWVSLVEGLSNLESLHVYGSSSSVAEVTALFPLLNQRYKTTESQKTRYCLPKLRRVELHKVTFRPVDKFGLLDVGDRGRILQRMKAFRDLIRKRKEAECPLEKIALIRCFGVLKEDVAVLQEEVEVDWVEVKWADLEEGRDYITISSDSDDAE
ncbi:hypothetical protein EIP91_012328 [Steccherinum ochraceum]|uniref:F-box domain-containing protein n=1 Tax=Steccherinum ochraceum TaxID=92696 RepID=A0A4V2MWT2_9APHY|nr:hypothetical protein EIP91_012328 [Steccherinum ochraceum]